MCNNVRGVKTKITSIKEIIEEEKPTIIGLVENKLREEDLIEIEGYEIKRMEREEEGGGVLLAYRESIKNIVMVVREVNKNCEMLWIKINNGKIKIRVGVIYMPQETLTGTEKLEGIYNIIEEEVQSAISNDEKVIIMGDMNCKVGKHIANNTDKVTKGGKMLLKLVKKYNLRILNAEECSQGTWTRYRKVHYRLYHNKTGRCQVHYGDGN